MSAQALGEIIAAHDDALRVVGAALDQGGPTPDLQALRAALRRRLEHVRVALAPPLSPEVAMEVLVPIVFFLDEYVQRELVRHGQAGEGSDERWPVLQADLFSDGRADGGDEFFERADELIRAADPEPIVVQAYLVCLAAGFVGRHFDEPAVLTGIRSRLADRLPRASSGAITAITYAAPRGARPSSRYWLLGIAGLALAQGLLALAALNG